jgi:stage II sporulation protein D
VSNPPPLPSRSGPPIRIALSTSRQEIRISAPGEFYLIQKIPEASKEILSGEIQIRVESEMEQASEIYRIQVASLAVSEAAEQLRKALAERFSLPAVTRVHETAGTTQVRLGEFFTREEAQEFAAGPLLEAGYRESFVVRESTTRGNGERTLALRGRGKLFRVSTAGYVFLPVSDTEFLRADGKPYRGVLDLSLNKNGRINVVNRVGIEEYLLGVLPAELPPTVYPQAAALAAQAVAARTYALKNLGRYRAEGFDLTADQSTQVYGGVTLEHTMASEAVRSTEGVALYYQGKLIEAMYSSTCGGKTEDFANVFDAPAVPYLTSVACAVENPSVVLESLVRGNSDLREVVFADDGTPANRYLELARVLGIVQINRLTAEYLGGPPTEEEARKWIETARRLAKRPPEDLTARPGDLTSRAGFLRHAAERFFGAQVISQRISASDSAYYLSNLKDGDRVPGSARSALAFLIQKGLWRPYPDNSARPGAPIKRSDALSLLGRWMESAQEEILKTGVFHELSGKNASVRRGNRTEEIPLAEEVRLFRRGGGGSVPVDSIRVVGGEKLSFHLSPAGEIDFLEVELNPAGTASDRFSPQATWQTTLLSRIVSEKLHPLASNIGELRDLVPVRLGASGRAVRIRVDGTRGSVVLNGYKVRLALGLKDTLFTIIRKHNSDGSIASYTFDGRGWGHGVGLCQVGAFGMAQAGRSFEEILKTYYRGVELRPAY